MLPAEKAPGIFGFGGIGNALAAGKSKFFPRLSLSDSMLNAVNKGLRKISYLEQ